MSIRVLHVIDHLGYGGAPIVVKNIVEQTNDQHIKTFVCALRTNPAAIPIETTLFSLTYRRYNPCTIFAIAKLCKKYKIDIIHAHLQKSIISSLLASFFCECAVVVHIHGGVFLKGMSFFLYRQLLRLLRGRASVFIANSIATVQKLVKRIKVSWDQIELLYNPVDFSVFEQRPGCREEMRGGWTVKKGDIVLGYAGRLHKVKGVDLLIEAFALLLQRSSNYLLLLAGDGPERVRLEGLARRLGVADKTRFLGMCEDVAGVMSGFDIGVVPSRHEPFGIVAVELMRMKVPIVSSGADGLAELVHDGETGVVTRENSPQEICRGIERLMENEKLRKQVVEAAYDFSKQFGIKEYVNKIQKIYECVL
ncbi:D-inositol-3-phosphate glycosyltransferase [subsurface metagenome]